MTQAILSVERLESRDMLSATTTLTTGMLSVIADNQTNYLVASTPSAGVTEIFDAVAKTTQDFSGVTSIWFRGGRGDNTFYNNTALPSTQIAGDGPSTTLLVGGSGNDTLMGGKNPASTFFAQDPGGSNMLLGGAGDNNLFGGRGSDTIISAGKSDEVYDILGTNTVSVAGGKGYAIVNAQSQTLVGSGITQVTFFQPALAINTSPVVLQKDVNGNGILWLNPQDPAGVSYRIDQFGQGRGATVQVVYFNSQGSVQAFQFPRSQVQWLASFGTPANDFWDNETSVNSVFYGSGGNDYIVGGTGINVLKGHSGNDLLEANGSYNDISAGPGSSLLFGSTTGFNIFRNSTATISTTDINVHGGDVLIGVPASVNGSYQPGRTGQMAANADYFFLYQYQQQRRRNSGGDSDD